MLGLGYAPYLDRAELQALQLEMRDAGQGFYVVRPGGVRDRYGPVVYLEPRTPANRDEIGRDMFADPQRHAAMARARDDNAVHMPGRSEEHTSELQSLMRTSYAV